MTSAKRDGTPADEAERTAAEPSAAAGPSCAAAVRRPGRPRNEALESTIIESVLDLLERDVPLADLSMERIAREAGVGKATVYRRWSGKTDLMLDVMRSLEEENPELPGESVRDDLVSLLEFLRRRGLAKRNSALMRTVITQVKAQPELWREYHDTVVQARRDALLAVLRRGIAGGEIRGDCDIDVLADLFVAPMLSRALLHEWKELPEGLAEQIVDTVLDGVRPRT
ncbi:TetR/AcrR family transcriptional regulator [Streptomyces sclerotialus]|uniref:TetR/AcrR family transcriptional regulator n=1 Tax=Streptomyces sclerotialus TaxID=1957 RepID=UPI00068D57E4